MNPNAKQPKQIEKLLEQMAKTWRSGNREEALRLALAFTEKYPRNAVGWMRLGEFYVGLEQFENARSAFEKSTKLEASLPNALVGLAFVQRRLNKIPETLQALMQAEQHHVRNVLLLRTWLSLADEISMTSDHIAALKRQITDSVDDLVATETIRVLRTLGDTTGALQFWKVYGRKPHVALAVNVEGARIFIDQKNWAEGKVAIDQVLSVAQTEREKAECHYLSGQYNQAKGELSAARQNFATALQHDASHRMAKAALAANALEIGDLEQAATIYEKIWLESEKKDGEIAFRLSQTLLTMRRIDPWFKMMDAVEQSPLSAHSRIKLWNRCNRAIGLYLANYLNDAYTVLQTAKSIQLREEEVSQFYKIYWLYLLRLLLWREKNQETYGRGDSVGLLHVIGESHALSANYGIVDWPEGRLRCVSHWLPGVKAYHVGASDPNRYHASLRQILSQLPHGAHLCFCIGEIDTRPDEGMWQFSVKRGVDPLELARTTAENYVSGIAKLLDGKILSSVTLQGVPAPGYKLEGKRDPGNKPLFLEMIALFNAVIKQHALDKGWRFLDVYTATHGEDGQSNLKWHIDYFHLQPGFYAFAHEWLAVAEKHKLASQEIDSAQALQAINSAWACGNYQSCQELALGYCQRAPADPSGWKMLGVSAFRTGNLVIAQSALQRAMQLSPDDLEIANALGLVEKQLSHYPVAEQLFRGALEKNPQFVPALANLGILLSSLGRHAEALPLLNRTLELNAAQGEVWVELGNIAFCQQDFRKARQCFEKAIHAQPNNASALFNLALVCREEGQYSQALALIQRGLAISKDSPHGWGALGLVASAMGEIEQSLLAYEKAVSCDPGRRNKLKFISSMLFTSHYLDSQERRHAARSKCLETYRDALRSNGNIKEVQRGELEYPLRVGVVSGDLRSHPVSYFLLSLLRSTTDIEWYAYATVDGHDAVSDELKQRCHRWHVIDGVEDAQAVELIKRDRVQILIDLSGHTSWNRLSLFALKPAPLQVSWLGYFDTTGLDEIDYVLTDWVSSPIDQALWFSEKLWRMPATRLCFTVPEDGVEPENARGDDASCVMACFQNYSKITETVIKAWGLIFAQLPNARLYFQSRAYADENIRSKLLQRLVKVGIAAERIEIRPATTRADYLASHNEIDFILDTFPYPGGTTTCEALWMGVPTITVAGRSMIERQGAMINLSLGLDDWVAESFEEYVSKAIGFAGNAAEIRKNKLSIRQRFNTSPLVDAQKFAGDFKTALEGMWHNRDNPRN